MGKILEFYSGKPFIHPLGFTIDYVWAWNWDVLETQHDYIQWLFPLTTRSAAIPRSPIITQDEVKEFKEDVELKKKLLKSLQVMLDFYGFSLESSGRIHIDESLNYKAGRWISAVNHNYWRISRILSSLSLLGLPQYAKELHTALCEIYKKYPDQIGASTMKYWDAAIGKST